MKWSNIGQGGLMVAVLAAVVSLSAWAAQTVYGAGRGDGPVIFVTSQQLYYDSIVTADLPPRGPFQELYMSAQGLTTDAGPGDPGYVGGRWWVDDNGNGEMDEGDRYFLCPLLGPGREEP